MAMGLQAFTPTLWASQLDAPHSGGAEPLFRYLSCGNSQVIIGEAKVPSSPRCSYEDLVSPTETCPEIFGPGIKKESPGAWQSSM